MSYHVCVLIPVQLFAIPWTITLQEPLSMEFSKNTKVDCHFLLQGIFLTQGSNLLLLYLLHWQVDSLCNEPSRRPIIPALYVEKTILGPLNYSSSFVEILVLSSIPLIYTLILMLVLHCFD